jgi:UDP-N-acetyl-D-glucosamine dehydrogenase
LSYDKCRGRKVAIVGQGYVGLPLAMRCVEVGYSVWGIDISPSRLSDLKAGKSYVEYISDKILQKALTTGRYNPSGNYEDINGFDECVITVPTPIKDRAPDLSFVIDACRSIGDKVKKGALVILESTTYPGTTRNLVKPIVEESSGLKAGSDFYLGYSPERIDPGNKVFSLENTPKIVSGYDESSADLVEEFYLTITKKVVRTQSMEEAELAKLIENTFRHVNIALINELAMFSAQLDINVWNAIKAASTKPFGYMPFYPGPGVGGHCLPVDPVYLSWRIKTELGYDFKFVDLANEINNHMPEYIVRRISNRLNKFAKSINGSKLIVFGLSYKPNTGDARESPALEIVKELIKLGAKVLAVDPYVKDTPGGFEIKRNIDNVNLRDFDLSIILVNHDLFDLNEIAASSNYIFDTRNCIRGDNVEYL